MAISGYRIIDRLTTPPMETNMQIKETVFEALQNAKDNYEFAPEGSLYRMNAAQVADDLAAFDAALENASPVEIEPFVAEWMAGQRWLHGNPNEAA